ncbi:MAG: hypothetical protein M1286_03815 [Candidatus Marsarchaeota archaeon]|nr:hypothetical protein [Candidatus Marsarchaeota archaeon]
MKLQLSVEILISMLLAMAVGAFFLSGFAYARPLISGAESSLAALANLSASYLGLLN